MAAFTKLVIMRVFENLLSVKPLEKITVKDITDQCGISRNTFYYHYQDIYQVFKAYIDYSLEEIFKFLQQENEKDQDHICEKAVEFLENHRTIFENILRSAKSEEVHKILDDGSSRFFRSLHTCCSGSSPSCCLAGHIPLADTGLDLELFSSCLVIFNENPLIIFLKLFRICAPEYQIGVSVQVKQTCFADRIKLLPLLHHVVRRIIVSRCHAG